MKQKLASDSAAAAAAGYCSCSPSSCIGSSVIITKKGIEEGSAADYSVQTKKPKRARGGKKIDSNSIPNSNCVKPRSSIFRGVTRHRWTGRFEAHLWDKTTWNPSSNKKGRQIYLGAYENEEDAARTYDLAAIKYWGNEAVLNFPVETYVNEIQEMKTMSKEEYLALLRRRSSGFARGVSKYRGVAKHHHNGRWEARIGRVAGNKYLYLGTYSTQEEAAAAYDMAAIEFRGLNAVTNFHVSNYADKLKKIYPDFSTEHKQVPKKEADEATGNQRQDGGNMIFPEIPGSKLMMDSGKTEAIVEIEGSSEGQEHPWHLCLDTDLNMAPLPDTPLDKSLETLDWLDAKGFEENIECIFDDGLSYEGKAGADDEMSGTGGSKAVACAVAGGDLNGQGLSTCGSSSSLSTLASVCSNV